VVVSVGIPAPGKSRSDGLETSSGLSRLLSRRSGRGLRCARGFGLDGLNSMVEPNTLTTGTPAFNWTFVEAMEYSSRGRWLRARAGDSRPSGSGGDGALPRARTRVTRARASRNGAG
jgi:hypothetical protein